MASLGSGPQSTWDDQPTDTANIKGFVVEYGVGAINPPMPTRLPPSLSGSGPRPAALDPGPVVPWPFSAGGNGHAFQAVCAPNGINWADAEAWAVAHGGHLASIHSMAENYLVFSLVNDPKFWNNATYDSVVYSIGPWLGGVKSPGVTAPAAGWQWFDGGGPFPTPTGLLASRTTITAVAARIACNFLPPGRITASQLGTTPMRPRSMNMVLWWNTPTARPARRFKDSKTPERSNPPPPVLSGLYRRARDLLRRRGSSHPPPPRSGRPDRW